MSLPVQDRIRKQSGPPPGPAALLALAAGKYPAPVHGLAGVRPESRKAMLAGRRPLPWLTALMNFWRPAFERGFAPGHEVAYSVLLHPNLDEQERESFRKHFDSARGRGLGLLRDFEEILRKGRRELTDRHEHEICDLLLHVVQDLKHVRRAAGRRTDPLGGAIAVNPDTLPLARWTVDNVLTLLFALWAIRRAHEDRVRWLVERYKHFQRLAGSFDGPGNLSAHHSPTWREEG